MRIEPYVWEEYAVYDKRGSICGVREDAPEEVKEAYEEDMQEYLNGVEL